MIAEETTAWACREALVERHRLNVFPRLNGEWAVYGAGRDEQIAEGATWEAAVDAAAEVLGDD